MKSCKSCLSLRSFRQVLKRIGATVVALDLAIRMYRCFEEGVMWSVRIIPVFVNSGPRFTIGIFNLLDDVLSPWKPFINLDSLQPSPLFQLESCLDPFAWIVWINLRELSTGLHTIVKECPTVGAFIVPVFGCLCCSVF